ncbi:hypothetical protein ACHAPK_011665 [Fusarium culmorum]
MGAVMLSSFTGLSDTGLQTEPAKHQNPNKDVEPTSYSMLSSIDLTPNIAAVALGDVNAPSGPSPVAMQTEVTTMGDTILAGIANTNQHLKERKQHVVSSVYCLLAFESVAAEAIAGDVPDAEYGTAYVPTTIPYQTQPDLSEITVENGMHIYADDESFSKSVTSLVDKYVAVWKDTRLINVKEDEAMTVPLVDNWYEHTVSQRPYVCRMKDKAFINDTLDKLVVQYGRVGGDEEVPIYG